MLTKIGGDIIAHSVNWDNNGTINQLYASICGSNSVALGIEKSNKFYFVQAAKTIQSKNVVERSNFAMDPHFRSISNF